MKERWESVRILIIDEESYLSVSDWENLDKKCRLLKREPAKVYGGVNIVAIGDKHQFCPVSGKPVFKVGWSEHCHGSVNCCIFLKNDHRFKDDPEFGHIIHRVRMGTATLSDIKTINKRWLGNPDD